MKNRYWKMPGLICEVPIGFTAGRNDATIQICGAPVPAYCRFCNGNVCDSHKAAHEALCTAPRPGTELYPE
jgi:hypothetical protein